MRKNLLIAFIFISLFSFGASAKQRFFTVTEKICDGEKIPVEGKEIVMVDLSQSEIGLGTKQDNGCATMDVMSTLTTKPRSKVNPTVHMETVEALSRKFTCSISTKPYQGMYFQSAKIKTSEVILTHTGSCAELVLKVQ